MAHWIGVGLLWAGVAAVLAGIVYLIALSIRKAEDPAQILAKWILTFVLVGGMGLFVFRGVGYSYGGAFVGPICCVVIGVILSRVWTPNLIGWLISPLTSAFDGGTSDWDPGPLYSTAVAHRKRGRYQEALQAVQKQLDRYPTDFAGQRLKAEIYADNLKDLSSATRAVEQILLQPDHAPQNVAFALHQLADWQVSLGADPELGRRTLQRIVDSYPGSEHAIAAAQRISHLGDATSLSLMRDRTPKTVKPGLQNVGLLKETPAIAPEASSPEEQAQSYVEHLELHPMDQEVREKLAALYADHYGRVDLAVDQLEQLIALPNQPPRHVARWLNQIADWHVRLSGNGESARLALQRIVDLFPGLAVAETATQRLARVALEVKAYRPAPQAVKMGVYEQNIGLKKKKIEQPETPTEEQPGSDSYRS